MAAAEIANPGLLVTCPAMPVALDCEAAVAVVDVSEIGTVAVDTIIVGAAFTVAVYVVIVTVCGTESNLKPPMPHSEEFCSEAAGYSTSGWPALMGTKIELEDSTV